MVQRLVSALAIISLGVVLATAGRSQAQSDSAHKPKDIFRECDKCPEMIVVPEGGFVMGSPNSEPEREESESPQHRVTLARPFAVGRFAVTFDEWDACLADGGCGGYRPPDAGWGRGRRPVINVTWDNVKAYLAWLSGKTGKPYRLLSEAEWEYMARAGTTTPFWWGSSISTQQANYNGNFTYGNGMKGENREQTLPVDSFAPNPWGVFQVSGNVAEWIEDCYYGTYGAGGGLVRRPASPADGSARVGTEECGFRVLRNASWKSPPADLRSAARGAGRPYLGADWIGFRVARALAP